MQTILQKQANMVKVTKGSRSDSSENAKNRGEILRGPTKKNFRQMALKLTELEHFEIFVPNLSYALWLATHRFSVFLLIGSYEPSKIRHNPTHVSDVSDAL